MDTIVLLRRAFQAKASGPSPALTVAMESFVYTVEVAMLSYRIFLVRRMASADDFFVANGNYRRTIQFQDVNGGAALAVIPSMRTPFH